MTCQERVELMQRYLDHDLNEAEELELMVHLQQCDECAGLFERLRRLDAELAQLPKVTPAYGLVDAIMPQLTELDRLPAAMEETAAKESVAAAPVGGILRTRRFFASWKLAGGVAVAAAMIGIFVIKEQNLLTPSLAMKGEATSSAESGKALDAKPAGSAAKPSNAGSAAAKKDAGPISNTSAVADMNITDQTADKSKAPAQAPAAEPPRSAGASNRPAAEPRGSSGQAASDANRVAISSSPPAASSGPAEGRNPAAASSLEADSGGTNPAQPAAQQAGEPTPPSPSSESAASANPAVQPAPTPQYKGIAATPPQDGQYSTLTAPAQPPAPATLKSPDGKLVASVEELKVVVRHTDSGDTVAASTYSWNSSDVVSFIGFSEDGKLTYRVQHQTGADQVTLDTAAKTETKTPVAKN